MLRFITYNRPIIFVMVPMFLLSVAYAQPQSAEEVGGLVQSDISDLSVEVNYDLFEVSTNSSALDTILQLREKLESAIRFIAGPSPEHILEPRAEENIFSAFSNNFPDSLKSALQNETSTSTDQCAQARQEYSDTIGNDTKKIASRDHPEVITKVAASCMEDPRSEAWWQEVSSRIGVLVDIAGNWGTPIFCTGFLITEQQIVTARHCFYKPTSRKSWERADHNDIYFVPFSRPNEKISIASVSGPSNNNLPHHHKLTEQSEDIAFAKLTESILDQSGNALTPLPEYAALQEEPLRIVGFYPELAYFSNHEKELSLYDRSPSHSSFDIQIDKILSEPWGDFLFYDAREMCRAWATLNENCIVHTCITVPGFSGSPMFAVREQSMEFVGSHVGVLLKKSSSCKPALYANGDILEKNGANFGIAMKQSQE